jgi:uncharacterized protein YegP (UPF0339 family)
LATRKLGKIILCVESDEKDYLTVIAFDQLGNKVDAAVTTQNELNKTLEKMKKHWEDHNYMVKIDKSKDSSYEAMLQGKFEIFNDTTGKFRFRLKAANNKIIASSEAYESKNACQNGIESIKKHASKARILDLTA